MKTKLVKVNAFWDSEVQVWVATSENVPGFTTEASDDKTLISKLRVLIPELLELNDCLPINRLLNIDLNLVNHSNVQLSLSC